MITKSQVTKAGYTILPKGAWLSINPSLIPEWHELAENYGFDPDAKEVILCIAGFKEVTGADNDKPQ